MRFSLNKLKMFWKKLGNVLFVKKIFKLKILDKTFLQNKVFTFI